jgi:hypothetical protein
VWVLLGELGLASAQPSSPGLERRIAVLEAAVAGLQQVLAATGATSDVAVQLASVESGDRVVGQLRRFQQDTSLDWEARGDSRSPASQVFKRRSATLAFTLAIGNGTADVGGALRILDRMAAVSDERRRPPMVVFQLGSAFSFKGVVRELSLRTPVIAPDGSRLSALADVTLVGAVTALSADEGAEMPRARPAR